MEWYQQEFQFEFPEPKKQKKKVDYSAVFELFRGNAEVTFRQIEEVAGVGHGSVANVIAVLSIKYPIYNPRRGVYQLVEGANFEKLKRENSLQD